MRPEGLEPPRVAPQDPKSCASTSSATVALFVGLELSESLRAPSGSVRIIPADREHAPAIHALQLLWLSRQCLAMATAGADRVARAPTHWHVDRVPGAGHHGPVLRPGGDELEGGSPDAARLPVHLEHHCSGRETTDFAPPPPTAVATDLPAPASPR